MLGVELENMHVLGWKKEGDGRSTVEWYIARLSDVVTLKQKESRFEEAVLFPKRVRFPNKKHKTVSERIV